VVQDQGAHMEGVDPNYYHPKLSGASTEIVSELCPRIKCTRGTPLPSGSNRRGPNSYKHIVTRTCPTATPAPRAICIRPITAGRLSAGNRSARSMGSGVG
jgi:hypothetical protein